MNTHKDNTDKSEKILSFLYTFLTVVFCAVIVFGGIYFIFHKDKEMSESENRVLQQKPSLTLSAVLDGSFMKSFETWLSDQFPLRDSIISFKTLTERTLGKKEQNGVFFGENGFLFEKQSIYNKKDVNKKLKLIGNFLKTQDTAENAVIISPNSSGILSGFLPEFVTESSQENQLNRIKNEFTKYGVKYIDSFGVLSSAKDKTKLFYRTDHHWTTSAASLVFKKLAKEWKLDTKNTKLKFYTVTDSFQGTLASTSGANVSFDKIQICVPDVKGLKYIVRNETANTKSASVFDKSKLETKNKYEVFFGGNFDKIVITTNNKNRDTLLVFKDSYANCFIPMLVPYFSKIVIVDPRYYGDKLQSITEEYDFSHILFLYNLNTFLEDTSIEKLFKSK